MRFPTLGVCSTVLVAALVTGVPAFAQDVPAPAGPWQRKLDKRLRELADRDDGATLRVIVRTRAGSEDAVHGQLAQKKRGVKRFGLSLVSGVTTDVTAAELRQLAEHPGVEHISVDAVVRSQQSSSDPCSTWYGSWYDDPCTQPESQYYALKGALGYKNGYWDGWNVGVAVIDSGVAASDNYNVTYFYDFTSGNAVSRSPIDGYGHGTHVAGIIANNGSDSNSHYQGVAPNARIIGLRVLDSTGAGMTSHVIKAIEFAVANRWWLGIDVINLSLGHPIYESAANDPLVLAVESAVRAGIVVVVSAGNMGSNPSTGEVGYGGISSPGNAPSAITVGAVDTRGTASRGDDTVAPYSSRGPSWIDGYAKPDVVAPGHRLIAPMPTGTLLYQTLPLVRVSVAPLFGTVTPHLRLSGTSMAAGVVSGVVAAMIDIQRTYYGASAPPNALKAMLQYSAIPLPDVDDLTQGAGQVNMAGALRIARRANPFAAQGGYWLTSSPGTSTVIEGQAWAWSQKLIWDNHVVWGDTVAYNQAVWANHVVWGDTWTGWNSQIVDGNHVVWGDTAVWVNHVVWGDSLIGRTDGNHVVWGDTAVTPASIAWQPLFGSTTASAVVGLLAIP